MENEECNKAIERIFPKINIDEINDFINNIECISNTRKNFYMSIINKRYEIIKRFIIVCVYKVVLLKLFF